MSQSFLVILIVVAVFGMALSLTRLAWPFSAMQELGRTGAWFHHQDDDRPEEGPDPNRNDPNIPRRPLRGRA